MSKWFCLKKKSKKRAKAKNADTITTTSITPSCSNDTEKLNLTEKRPKICADEINTFSFEEKPINIKVKDSHTISTSIPSSFASDLEKLNLTEEHCTGSMRPFIAAARDCILQVTNYIKHTNPSIELRVGFCGYRDHIDGEGRLLTLDFTDQYEQFTTYLQSVPASGGGDAPEDVLGGLNAAITKMDWKNVTRVLLHIGDYPPHGKNFTDMADTYPKGDPHGLTAENVLEKLQSKNILYFFGKITDATEKMLQIFRGIIGEFPLSYFAKIKSEALNKMFIFRLLNLTVKMGFN
ncbi:hypothetical protein RhiirA1_507549 [Rhizophagus irregularis]|uniref:VWFA domain-containing protein n=1 Tax=Rhizophagus irregularis TaxID=588596 RepID=A0A2N0QT41_9GLOM|nr:hypothetical protein RhiirA1_507549 [Rhizophagus irregularis]